MQLETRTGSQEEAAAERLRRRPIAANTRHWLLFALFTTASFLGAGLLFSVQPMVAKMLLPQLGGSAAVWNTAMVFFQLQLLLGYAYAHFAATRLNPRLHRYAQVGLTAVPLLLLPIALPAGWTAPTTTEPAVWVLLALLVMVGAPFFALATLSPTLQRWLAETDHPMASNPYFLYAASNAGSLLALLAYPLVLEPLLDVSAQSQLWTGLYIALIVLVGAAAWMARPVVSMPQPAQDTKTEPAQSISWRQRGFWTYAAFVPSVLMLGVMRFISTDVASFPLLWVIPLALYLLTFVIAFRGEPVGVVRYSAIAFQFLVIPAVLSIGLLTAAWTLLLLPLAAFTAAALMAHGRLMLSRPDPRRLTEFYLWISIGGAAGGVFASLIAPMIFDRILEYPIGLVLALTLIPLVPGGKRLSFRVLAAGAIAAALFSAILRNGAEHDAATLVAAIAAVAAFAVFRSTRVFVGVMAVLVAASLLGQGGTLYSERTFFGFYRVYESSSGDHVITSGTTIHGVQPDFGTDQKTLPSNYYHPTGPIGQILLDRRSEEAIDVAVVGLGAGTLAAYSRPSDSYTFYEIDPAVVDIAEDTELFTYLADADGSVEIVVGDGRLMLEQEDDRFDVIVLDAFSSDAIPTHLLTKEALSAYADHLQDGGLIAVHISNRHLNLEPVLGRLAQELGLEARSQRFEPTPEAQEDGAVVTWWVVLAPSEQALGPIASDEAWALARTDASVWTDAYTSILEILSWN